MPIDGLFSSSTLKVLKLGLDAYSMRGRAISANLANAFSDGYRAKRVMFEDSLRAALSQQKRPPTPGTEPGHRPVDGSPLDNVSPKQVTSREPAPPGSVNNVVIEREMANLAQNELLFKFAADKIAGGYRTLKAAIRGEAR